MESVGCPVCGKLLKVIGTRERKVTEVDGNIKVLIIRRLRCTCCRKIHHELPDILVPYKRHCAETVGKIVGGDAEGVCCEESTIRKIRRWWVTLHIYFQSVLASLEYKFSVRFAEPIKPAEVVRAVANGNLWIHTRSAWASG